MTINRKLPGEKAMASWVKCTTTDGTEFQLNLEHVAMIRPHHSDRGFTGSEIIFAAGNLSSILIKETQEHLTAPPRIERGHAQV
jgi:hypothetical protein